MAKKVFIILLSVVLISIIIIAFLIFTRDNGFDIIEYDCAVTTEEAAIKLAEVYIAELCPEFMEEVEEVLKDGNEILTYETIEINSNNWFLTLIDPKYNSWRVYPVFRDASDPNLLVIAEGRGFVTAFISRKTGELLLLTTN